MGCTDSRGAVHPPYGAKLYDLTELVIFLVAFMLAACNTSNEGAPFLSGQHPSRLLTGPYSYIAPPSRTPHGSLVFSDRQFPDAVNPLFSGSTVDFEVSAALWAAPIFFDQRFHVHADQLAEVPLPENGDVRDNGQTIIMHLRHDLRWSDGQPILASDFAYWWHLDQDPNTGALITSGYDQIASIDTPDNFTVILHMKHPFGPYLLYLPYAAPRHAWGSLQDIDLQNQPGIYLTPRVTDGPYMLSSFVNGRSFTMVPNPYYTSTTFHGPFLSQLIYRSYTDLNALSASVRSRQSDLSEDYMEYELPQLQPLPPAVKLSITPAAAYEHLDFNNAMPFFQDIRVRQAIQLAINKCDIIRTVLHAPDCSRLASQVEPLPSLVYDSSIHPSAYDPAAARRLLAQAGWLPGAHGILAKHGQSFIVRLATTSDNPLRAAAAVKIQHELLAVGIQVKIFYYPLNTFFAFYNRGGILATGAFDLAMFGYTNSPDPDDEYTVFHSSQIPSATHPDLGNYARIHDPIIDQALTQARYTVAFSDRLTLYHRFLERLASQVYIIPLYVGVNIMTISSTLRNALPDPDPVANNWNLSDWWVEE